MNDQKIYRWAGICSLAAQAFFFIEFPFYLVRSGVSSVTDAAKLADYTVRNGTNIMTCTFLDLIILTLVMIFLAGFRIGLNVEPMEDGVNGLLFELNEIYSEMGQSATTDFDEKNSHDNSILNVLESNGLLIYFQLDKDWHYREGERRWVALNDKSGWRRAEIVNGKVSIAQLHVR